MTRDYIIMALVFAAIVTVEKCFPVTVACLAVAWVLTYVKTFRTD